MQESQVEFSVKYLGFPYCQMISSLVRRRSRVENQHLSISNKVTLHKTNFKTDQKSNLKVKIAV